MIVTEIVIETRDAKETATGTVTATETGIATDGTLACHSLVIVTYIIADDHSCFSSQLEASAGAGAVAITGNLRTVSDAATCVSLALSPQYYLMSSPHPQRRRRSPRSRSPSPSRSRRRSASPGRRRSRRSRSHGGSSRSRSRDRDHKSSEALPRSLGGPINAPHEEAVEFAKHSKRENRVYVGNLSYDVKYRDLIEFMRGGGWGRFSSWLLVFLVVVAVAAAAAGAAPWR
jgi:hypothetical protein